MNDALIAIMVSAANRETFGNARPKPDAPSLSCPPFRDAKLATQHRVLSVGRYPPS